MIIMMFSEIVQLLFIVKVDKLGGFPAIKEKYGNIVYFTLSVPILLILLLKTGVYTAETNSYANSYLFYNLSTRGVGIIVILAACYIAVKGAKGIGRMMELLLWLVPIGIIIGALFGKLKLTPLYALPIGANGIVPIASGYDATLFWTLDFSPLLFLKIREDTSIQKRKRSKFPWVPICTAATATCMVALYLLYVMNYGNAGHLVDTAFSSLGAFNVVNTEIGSIDWPAITLWLSIAIVSLALKLFGTGKALSSFKLKFPLAVLLSALVIIALSQFAFYNLERAFDLALSKVRYAVFTLELIIPMMTFILLDLKERRQGGNKLEKTV